MTTVKLLDEAPDTLGLNDLLGAACPCGWRFDYPSQESATHDREHLEWALGVPLTKGCFRDPWDTLARVVGTDSPFERRIAYKLACRMQREEGYDLPLLPRPSVWKAYRRCPRAYLALWRPRQRAVALLVVGDCEQWGLYGNTGAEVLKEPCPSVVGIFVCADHRRRGLATRLVTAAAECEGIAVADFAWGLPFSKAGRHLALSITPESALRITGGVPWR